jgi:phosphate/sulfate permease
MVFALFIQMLMKKTTRLTMLLLIVLLLISNLTTFAHGMNSIKSAEGKIVLIKQRAMINMNGTNYLILKENTAYAQFENRYIKMYNIHIDNLKGYLIIDFSGFRFIDAFV